jgi:hypothetical protein
VDRDADVINDANRRSELAQAEAAREERLLAEDPGDLDPCEIDRFGGRRSVKDALLRGAGPVPRRCQ